MARYLLGDSAADPAADASAGKASADEAPADGAPRPSTESTEATLPAAVRVLRASMVEDVSGSRADISTVAELTFRAATITIPVMLRHSSVVPMGFNVHATFTNGSFYAFNYLFPFAYHYLRVSPAGGARSRIEKHYTAAAGGAAPLPAESTFTLQLQAFAGAIQRHRLEQQPLQHVPAMPDGLTTAKADATLDPFLPGSAVRNMAILDEIYEVAGLGRRGALK